MWRYNAPLMAEPAPDRRPQTPHVKPYVKPMLIDYGTVRSSTGRLDMKGQKDGGPSNAKT